MHLSSLLRRLLEKFSDELYLKFRESKKEEFLFEDCLNWSIEIWCRHLCISSEDYKALVKGWHDQKMISILDRMFLEFKGSLDSQANQKNSAITELANNFQRRNYQNVEANRYPDVQIVLLIGFVIVSIGYAVSLLHKSKQKLTPEDTTDGTISQLKPVTQSWNLVLVVNAGQKMALESLKANGKVIKENANLLYQATQEIWMGTTTEFSNSKIKQYFDFSSESTNFQETEYDVYFIKIELFEYEAGFRDNVKQLDRLDAFLKLPEKSGKIEVSRRLPSRSYNNVGLYSR